MQNFFAYLVTDWFQLGFTTHDFLNQKEDAKLLCIPCN
jgi:hypothetical protein